MARRYGCRRSRLAWLKPSERNPRARLTPGAPEAGKTPRFSDDPFRRQRFRNLNHPLIIAVHSVASSAVRHMRSRLAGYQSSAAVRVLAVAILAASLGACSSDVARFSSNPFSNPFGSPATQPDRTSTGSIGRSVGAQAQSAAVSRVPAAAAVTAKPLASPSAASVTGSITPRAPSAVDLATSRSAMTSAAAVSGPVRTFNGWSSAGGTPIQAGSGDSVNTIAARYGVPAPAIIATNGLSTSALRPGQQLIIPVYNAADAASRRTSSAQSEQPAPVAPAQAPVRPQVSEAPPRPAAPIPAAPVPATPRPQQALAPQSAPRQPAPPQAPPQRMANVAPQPTRAAQPVVVPPPAPQRVAAPRQVESAAVDAARERARAQAEAARARAEAAKAQAPKTPAAAPANAAAQARADEERRRLAEARAQAESERARAAEARKAAEAERQKAADARRQADAERQKQAADARKAAEDKARADRQQAEARSRAEREQRQQAQAAPAKVPNQTTVQAQRPAQPDASAETTGSTTQQRADFRWPVRGRVIGGFSGRGSNEGINIAVPEGTPVKAAGEGVVAYAGNELKGYGNLVLIRHDNGYVSAYAHNGDISVRRGERVQRGQVIARSGQTGNVASPQLHFEIRKGSNPVDPLPYLNN